MTTAEVTRIAASQVEATFLQLKGNVVLATKEGKEKAAEATQYVQDLAQLHYQKFTGLPSFDNAKLGSALLELFVWNSWNQMSMGFGVMIGYSQLTDVILNDHIARPLAALFALLIIPFFLYSRMNKLTPDLAKFGILVVCLPWGVLAGYSMLSYNVHIYAPPAFAMTLLLGGASNAIARTSPNRLTHTSVVVVAYYAVAVAVALALNNVIDKLYVLLLLVAVLLVAVDLHVKLEAVQSEDVYAPVQSLLFSVVSSLMLDYVVAFVTPLDKATYIMA